MITIITMMIPACPRIGRITVRRRQCPHRFTRFRRRPSRSPGAAADSRFQFRRAPASHCLFRRAGLDFRCQFHNLEMVRRLPAWLHRPRRPQGGRGQRPSTPRPGCQRLPSPRRACPPPRSQRPPRGRQPAPRNLFRSIGKGWLCFRKLSLSYSSWPVLHGWAYWRSGFSVPGPTENSAAAVAAMPRRQRPPPPAANA